MVFEVHMDELQPLRQNEKEQIKEAYRQEYDTLREECLQSMGNRTQIIAFGLGTLAVLIGGTLSMENRLTETVNFMFNYAVPFISTMVYYAWFAEFERMVRAGKFLKDLEDAINEFLPRRVLSWEHDLTTMRMGYAYLVIAILFLGIAAGSPFLIQYIPISGNQQQSLVLGLRAFSRDGFLSSPYIAWSLVVFSIVHTGRQFKYRLKKFGKSILPFETRSNNSHNFGNPAPEPPQAKQKNN